MFIRTRTYKPAGEDKATTYFQLAKCHRVNGKPRQVIIASWVGVKKLPEAIKAIETQVAAVQAKLAKFREQRKVSTRGGRYGRPSLGFVNFRIKEESFREKSLLSRIEKLRLALPEWEKFCKIDLSQSPEHSPPRPP